MEIENWESAGALPLLYAELKQLGLESNVAELEAFGFTVVPPEKVGPPELHLQVKEAVERVVRRRQDDMVRVREARRAFRKFHATCFWSYRKDLEIGPADVGWVTETLRKNGDMRAWKAAARLCP